MKLMGKEKMKNKKTGAGPVVLKYDGVRLTFINQV
jgi:hypothetical protein